MQARYSLSVGFGCLSLLKRGSWDCVSRQKSSTIDACCSMLNCENFRPFRRLKRASLRRRTSSYTVVLCEIRSAIKANAGSRLGGDAAQRTRLGQGAGALTARPGV
jgi:hypothetical protein